jgi:hypothetical protein
MNRGALVRRCFGVVDPDPARLRARRRRGVLLGGLAGAMMALAGAQALAPGPAAQAPTPLAEQFVHEVTMRLAVPSADATLYALRLEQALADAKLTLAAPQFVLLVDRSENVQSALLFWGSSAGEWRLVGAAPVSTGLSGRYEHFVTPLGVFKHGMDNPDFRAEGSKNKLGFRGYGKKGMRIYDLGWVAAPRGWGDGAMGELRLQMHATDPELAESRLGTRQSEGCVRIPASLNDFLDRRGVLDADYERALAEGRHLWVLRADRTPTPTAGSYIVVVDSDTLTRPAWAALPPAGGQRANVSTRPSD